MANIYFISHPEVQIDPNIPVPQWGLSEVGRARLTHLFAHDWISTIEVVYSSEEQKAREAAIDLASLLLVQHLEDAALGEMDRSATGFLPPEEFEKVVNEAFAHPELSIRGWEALQQAQERIVRSVFQIVESNPGKNIAIVSHGGVGTLLLCRLKNVPISRSEDQKGQGNYFIFTAEDKELIQEWTRFEQ